MVGPTAHRKLDRALFRSPVDATPLRLFADVVFAVCNVAADEGSLDCPKLDQDDNARHHLGEHLYSGGQEKVIV